MRYLLFLLLAFSGSVFGQALPTSFGGPAGGTLVPGSLSSVGEGFRDIAANATTGETVIRDRVRVGIGAANAEMFAQRAVPFARAMALGARLLPVIGTAATLYTIYESLGCHVVGVSIQCEAGISLYTYQNYNATSQRAATPEGVIRLWIGSTGTLQTFSCPTIPRDSSGVCTFKWIRLSNGATVDSQLTIVHNKSSGAACAGGAAFRPDGLCPGGALQPKTDDEAAQIVAPYVPKASAVDVVRQALQQGINISPYVEPRTATGPASLTQPATTKTTVAPNGTTQVQTQQVTSNITYSGDNYSVTNTTVINNPDGSTETVQEAPQKDLCEAHPGTVGCAPLGDLPTDQPAWETKTIAYQADSLGLPAACPAPWTGQLRGWTLSFSYQPACDVAPQVRLAILALTTLGALLMIITTVRT